MTQAEFSSPRESSPTADVLLDRHKRVMQQKGISLILPKNFPQWYETIPFLQGLDVDRYSYMAPATVMHKTAEFSEEEVMQLASNDTINVLDLLRHQRRLIYPSKTIKLIPKLDRNRAVHIALGSDADLSPDIPRGVEFVNYGPEETYDKSICDILVLKLALQQALYPVTDEPIESPEELRDAVGDLPINWNLLLNRFSLLMDSDRVAKLEQSGVIHDGSIDNFFTTVTRWRTDLVLNMIESGRTNLLHETPFTTISPRLYRSDLSEYPDARALPAMARGLLYFYAVIPDVIGEDQDFGRLEIKEKIDEFYRYSLEVLANHMETRLGVERYESFAELQSLAKAKLPQLFEEVGRIQEDLVEIVPGFEALLKLYREIPGLLNRKVAYQPSSGGLQTYQDLRQEILDSRAKASRKPFFFRLKHGAPSGRLHAETKS